MLLIVEQASSTRLLFAMLVIRIARHARAIQPLSVSLASLRSFTTQSIRLALMGVRLEHSKTLKHLLVIPAQLPAPSAKTQTLIALLAPHQKSFRTILAW